ERPGRRTRLQRVVSSAGGHTRYQRRSPCQSCRPVRRRRREPGLNSTDEPINARLEQQRERGEADGLGRKEWLPARLAKPDSSHGALAYGAAQCTEGAPNNVGTGTGEPINARLKKQRE